MPRRSLLRILAGAAVLVAVVSFGLWSYPWPNGVTRENWDRIELGMSLGQLEDLLGPHLDQSELRSDDISYTGKWVNQGGQKLPEYADDPGYPGEFHFWLW